MKTLRFSIATLLMATTLVCISIAWWIESNRPPEILYLHLYSTRYDIHSMNSDLSPPPRSWQCIATLAVSPGVKFYADMPNHYEPAIVFRGELHRADAKIETDFTIDLQDVGLAISHNQNAPMEIGDTYDFHGGEFRLRITDRFDPPLQINAE